MILWIAIEQDLSGGGCHPEAAGIFSTKKGASDYFFHKLSVSENYDDIEDGEANMRRFNESTQDWLASPKNDSWWAYIWEDTFWSVTPLVLNSHHGGWDDRLRQT